MAVEYNAQFKNTDINGTLAVSGTTQLGGLKYKIGSDIREVKFNPAIEDNAVLSGQSDSLITYAQATNILSSQAQAIVRLVNLYTGNSDTETASYSGETIRNNLILTNDDSSGIYFKLRMTRSADNPATTYGLLYDDLIGAGRRKFNEDDYAAPIYLKQFSLASGKTLTASAIDGTLTISGGAGTLTVNNGVNAANPMTLNGSFKLLAGGAQNGSKIIFGNNNGLELYPKVRQIKYFTNEAIDSIVPTASGAALTIGTLGGYDTAITNLNGTVSVTTANTVSINTLSNLTLKDISSSILLNGGTVNSITNNGSISLFVNNTNKTIGSLTNSGTITLFTNTGMINTFNHTGRINTLDFGGDDEETASIGQIRGKVFVQELANGAEIKIFKSGGGRADKGITISNRNIFADELGKEITDANGDLVMATEGDATFSGNGEKFTPVIAPITTPSGINNKFNIGSLTNGSSPVTGGPFRNNSSLPSEINEFYYVVKSEAAQSNKNIDVTPNITKAGWIDEKALTKRTVGIGLNASETTFIPIASAEVSLTGGALSQGAATGGIISVTATQLSKTDDNSNIGLIDDNTSGIKVSFTVTSSGGKATCSTLTNRITRAAVNESHTSGFVKDGYKTKTLNSETSEFTNDFVAATSDPGTLTYTKYVGNVVVPSSKSLVVQNNGTVKLGYRSYASYTSEYWNVTNSDDEITFS